MRVRLQAIVLSLVALLVFGLGVPLALSVAASSQQRLFLDRLTDTSRFASLAQRPLLDDRPELLESELRRYSEVYGVPVEVLDQEGKPFVSGGDVDEHDPAVLPLLQAALAGRRSEPGSVLVPWDDSPLVLAEPILIDGEVRGAVLSVSPTAAARSEVLRWWLVIAAGGLLAFGLALLGALPVVRWILRPVHRLDDATGELVSAVVSGREVARVGDEHGPPELRQLGRSFDRMAASVGTALAAQRAFVADASHQLRNPLTALTLRLANLDGHVDENADEHRRAAAGDAERLNQILDGLLSMARAESSAGELVAVEIDIAVRERVEDWQVVAAARGVGLVLHDAETGVRVLVPPRGVEVVLDALLDNAIKFSARETEVVVSVRRKGELVELAVRDHGPGLRPDELERATDRFWRSTAHQNVPGSGLGLAIVTEIARNGGGDLRLALPDGGGLEVVVTLAVAEGNDRA
ncbi:sensor histidine kinase [Amycolatopsis sp. CA-230715]|uniref:sensor histidine kinase n=1 Tax=Amycolatopsis sp. CA-230715 TaxID=2745196 RepID=UPI001C032048|nr:HAMP domain-containing sensor histidine kinase [Amycolatopsis sp. CA-230715]QWF77611.1 Adaptive-response sensory-kinase SasA [Amycolatopsis sp. CA-230715]